MSENSKIEWTDHTFNPWEGCQKVGPGCDHCYAETRNARFAGGTAINWGPDAPRRRTSASNWNKPRLWNLQAGQFFAEHGRRQRVFCASLADVFDNAVDLTWRMDLLELIAATPNLDWLLLTKRVGNVLGMVPEGWFEMHPNVWMGATIVNQAEADRDIAKLLRVPARVRFLSMEPLIEPVSFRWSKWACQAPSPHVDGHRGHLDGLSGIHWVIVGGESGPGARPTHPDWARDIRDQCEEAGVPFLFKQWGEHDLSYDRDRDDPDWRQCGVMDKKPGRWINLSGGHGFHGDRVHYAHRIGKKAAGRLLDGREWNGFPHG